MSMWQPFREQLRRAIVLAQEEATRLGSGWIGSEHVLLGILAEGESRAAKLLVQWCVSLEPAREIAAAFGAAAGVAPPSGSIEFTANAKESIERAFEVAREFGHDHVSAEHMLLGMTRQQTGGARHIFEMLIGPNQMIAFGDAVTLVVKSEPPSEKASNPFGTALHSTTIVGRSAMSNVHVVDERVALYTECLHAASLALGPGAGIEAVRAAAKTLFEGALTDIAAARKEE
jgi:ATP-dependent Clp protease ATP-binding subunit ClpA